MSLFAPSAPLTMLDDRARDIFRRIVETYLETGEPVGSRTLSMSGRVAVARLDPQHHAGPDLAGPAGRAPHVSAGRLPTHAGLRLFVDGLLEVGDVGEEERREIDAAACRAHGRSFEEALDEASSLLSGLAGGAGVVVSPVRDAGVKHVEFVALGRRSGPGGHGVRGRHGGEPADAAGPPGSRPRPCRRPPTSSTPGCKGRTLQRGPQPRCAPSWTRPPRAERGRRPAGGGRPGRLARRARTASAP